MRHVALLPWLPLALAGCQLIDQRTFEAKAVAPPPSALQALAAGNQRPTLPLVTIPPPAVNRALEASPAGRS